MNSLNQQIDTLIEKGNQLTFQNNSFQSCGDTYGRPSAEFQAWTILVEDFIFENYGEESPAFRQYKRFDINVIEGYYSSIFNTQHSIIIGALKACKDIQPKKQNKKNTKDDKIISLISNPFFWGVLVVIIGATFALGIHFGTAKFDKEKSDYYDGIKKLNFSSDSLTKVIQNDIVIIKANADSLSLLNQTIKTKDSIINKLVNPDKKK